MSAGWPARAGRVKRSVFVAGVSLSVLFSAACTPPGKPTADSVEAETPVMDFAGIFEQNCAGCHGANGMKGPGRPINNALYLAWVPKEQLQSVIENGRPGTAMPPWSVKQGGPLNDKQIDVLVNGIEQNWAKPVSVDKTNMPDYSGDSQTGEVTNGKKLFMRGCFMCHGKGAPVGMVTDPTYLQLVSNQMLRTSIVVGRLDLTPMKMPDYRTLNLGHALSNQDVSDIVAYLASLRPPTTPEGAHTNENGSGQAGEQTKGNEGSGHGPGSPHQERGEGNKSTGASSMGGPK